MTTSQNTTTANTNANVVAFPTVVDVAVLEAQKAALILQKKQLDALIAETTKKHRQQVAAKQTEGQVAAVNAITESIGAMLAEKGLTVADLRGSESFKLFINQEKREVRKITSAEEKMIAAYLSAGVPSSTVADKIGTSIATITSRRAALVAANVKIPVLTAKKANGDTWTAGDKGIWPESAKTMVSELMSFVDDQLAAEKEVADESQAEAPF